MKVGDLVRNTRVGTHARLDELGIVMKLGMGGITVKWNVSGMQWSHQINVEVINESR